MSEGEEDRDITSPPPSPPSTPSPHQRGSLAARGSIAPKDRAKGIQRANKQAAKRGSTLELRLSRLEGRFHRVLQNLPVALPLTGALVCIFLLLIPQLQSPVEAPWLFQSAIFCVILSAVCWVVLKALNDCMHARHGLLPKQKVSTTVGIFIVGSTFALLRLMQIAWMDEEREQDMTTERLQRIITGGPYFVFRSFGLDMWGWLLGSMSFYIMVFGGLFMLFCFNCCGRVRLVQFFTRRTRDAMPFTDMVSNRVNLPFLNAMLFVFPFCILSTYVLGGSVLIDPRRTFLPAAPPASMRPLCSPVATRHIYGVATNAVNLVMAEVLPEAVASTAQARAVANVVLDLMWRRAFEPIERACDGMHALPLPPGADVAQLPPLAFALRDRNALAASVSPLAGLTVELTSQPADCGARAHLAGPSGALLGTAGVGTFTELRLVASDGLCAGDYSLYVALREWPEDELASRDGLLANDTTTREAALARGSWPPGTLNAKVAFRLVRAQNYTDVRSRSWSVDMPRYFNASSMVVTSSVVTYYEVTSLHEIITTVRTNTTTVGWEHNTSHESYNESAPLDPGAAATTGAIVWPSNGSVPTTTTSETVHRRPPTHILSLLVPPPSRALLKQPFDVSLRLTTETGIALAGEQVQAIMLAPIGSAAKLAPGAFGYTDEDGIASFTLTVDTAVAGDYLLLFGSAGTMRTELRQDIGATITAMADALKVWRRLVEPFAGTSASVAEAVRSDQLHALLQQRIEAAMRQHMSDVVNEMDSCLALLNYTDQALIGQEQQTVELTFDTSGGVAGLLSSLASNDVAWSGFSRAAIAGASPEALPCYERAQQAAAGGPMVSADPAGAASTLATALVQSLLDASGLSSLAAVVGVLAPYTSNLEQQLAQLNQTMMLSQEAISHFSGGDRGSASSWQALLRLAVLLTFGFGAPPAHVLTVESGIGSVELTAPLLGYSLFTSASTDPSRNQDIHNGVIGSACVQEGYPSFMPPLRPFAEVRSTSFVTRVANAARDAIRIVAGLPVAAPLWQPPLFLTQNYLLDPISYLGGSATTGEIVERSAVMPHFGTYSPLCVSSFLTANQTLPGTARYPGASGVLSRATLARDAAASFTREETLLVVADPFFPRYELAAELLEALNGSATSVADVCDSGRAGEALRHALGLEEAVAVDVEVCGFAVTLATYYASLEVTLPPAPPAPNASDTNATQNASSAVTASPFLSPPPPAIIERGREEAIYFSARPKLIVRGARGEPLAGRYCTVSDESESGDGLADMLKLKVSVDRCGPSNERGEIEIEGVRVRGGASRQLQLQARVEGTLATLSPKTFWQRDTQTFYFSADQPSFDRISLVTMSGHDSVRLLALLAMPLFALNGRSLRDDPPHILWRIGAVGAFAYFFWISLAFLERLVGPADLPDWIAEQRTTLIAISTNDLTPIRTAAGEPLAHFVAALCFGLTCAIAVALGWLLIKSETAKMRKRARRKVTKLAVKSVKGLSRMLSKMKSRSRRGLGGSPSSRDNSRNTHVDGSATDGDDRRETTRDDGRRSGDLDEASAASPTPRVESMLERFVAHLEADLEAAKSGKRRKARGDKSHWIEPAPNFWKESEASRRARTARNHVRTMLRGRRSYAEYVKRQGESFFYPQRLWMAFALSVWIQMIVTLFFTNMVRWMSAVLIAAEDFDTKITAEAQYQVAIDESDRFGDVFRLIMLLVWAVAAPQNRGNIMHGALFVVAAVLPALCFLVLLGNWVHVLMLYKRRMLALRRGVYFFDRATYREDFANQYIGFQIAGMTLSAFFFLTAGVALSVPLTVVIIFAVTTTTGLQRITDTAQAATFPVLYSLGTIVMMMIVQKLLNSYLFFVGAPSGNRWLRHRWWYALYDYNMIFSNTLVGLAVMTTRFILWLVLGLFCLGRIDLSLLPGPGQLEVMDIGYRTYIAVLRQDHRYNHPVCVTFFNLMMDHVAHYRSIRARNVLRRHVRLTWLLGVALFAFQKRGTGKLKWIDRSALRQNVSNFLKRSEREKSEKNVLHLLSSTMGAADLGRTNGERSSVGGAAKGGRGSVIFQRPYGRGSVILGRNSAALGRGSIIIDRPYGRGSIVCSVNNSARSSTAPRSMSDVTGEGDVEEGSGRPALPLALSGPSAAPSTASLGSNPSGMQLLDELTPTEILMAEQELARNSYRLARNRWQLALMLLRNPVLQGYRGHALEVMFERTSQLQDDVAALKEGDKQAKKKRAAEKSLCRRVLCCGCDALCCKHAGKTRMGNVTATELANTVRTHWEEEAPEAPDGGAVLPAATPQITPQIRQMKV